MYHWGIIGLSEGNGHPFSWSAIVNGYDAQKMEKCGFPVIPRYLEQHQTPDPRLDGFEIASVYTQDASVSRQIAETCHIPYVASSLQDLAQSVDAIIVARDDAETHYEYAQTLLPFGKPVFFDKPLAYSSDVARQILAMQTYDGQVWSASGLSFEPALDSLRKDSGDSRVISVDAHISGPWQRYAIHLIEPLFHAGVIDRDVRLVYQSTNPARTVAIYESVSESESAQIRVTCWSKHLFAVPPTTFVVYAVGVSRTVVLSDTYEAFTRMLCRFASICQRNREADISPMIDALTLIEQVYT